LGKLDESDFQFLFRRRVGRKKPSAEQRRCRDTRVIHRQSPSKEFKTAATIGSDSRPDSER
jgi:hypothetical protein